MFPGEVCPGDIKRMVQDGLLEAADAPEDGASGGPKRRYYRITGYGRKVARAEGLRITRLQHLVAGTSLLDGAQTSLTGEAES